MADVPSPYPKIDELLSIARSAQQWAPPPTVGFQGDSPLTEPPAYYQGFLRSHMLALDISNFTADFTVKDVENWKDAGVGLVIVQAVIPNGNLSLSKTRSQLDILATAEMPRDCYLYGWCTASLDYHRPEIALAEGYALRRWQLDIEDTTPSTPQKRKAAYDALYAILAQEPAALPPGRYLAPWYLPYLPDVSDWAQDPVWIAQYDGVADIASAKPFGPFNTFAIKQYIAGQTFCGISGVDINVLSAEEEATLTMSPTPPVPQDYQDKFGCGPQDWPCVAANLEGIINQLQETVQSPPPNPDSDSDIVAEIQTILKNAGYGS